MKPSRCLTCSLKEDGRCLSRLDALPLNSKFDIRDVFNEFKDCEPGKFKEYITSDVIGINGTHNMHQHPDRRALHFELAKITFDVATHVCELE
nr:hypothetical protein [Tanacetum cinerariifolium]